MDNSYDSVCHWNYHFRNFLSIYGTSKGLAQLDCDRNLSSIVDLHFRIIQIAETYFQKIKGERKIQEQSN